ncbi:hypothetical protein LY78DRAFT_660334 [Colletotrichum sublineola]|nr:hypothetical protein LY78DRAFT_660334 [Colletotrichum sublineola]
MRFNSVWALVAAATVSAMPQPVKRDPFPADGTVVGGVPHRPFRSMFSDPSFRVVSSAVGRNH